MELIGFSVFWEYENRWNWSSKDSEISQIRSTSQGERQKQKVTMIHNNDTKDKNKR